MKIAYDLHIHSALSPCGNRDMTPNNIVNMAYIKGLNLISITDHNAMDNIAPVIELAKVRNILVLPGIEVTTKEDIHVLCYFSSLTDGLGFQKLIYEALPNVNNDEKLFGEQLIFDCNDTIVGNINKLLINGTDFTIEEIENLARKFNGVMVPAHVDKSAYSIISSLGFIPDTLNINAIEVYNDKKFNSVNNLIYKEKYIVLNNSDAHYLVDIKEAVSFMDLDILTTDSVIDYLKGWRNKY